LTEHLQGKVFELK